MRGPWDVIVVGSGPSGIATAANLIDRGIRPLVLEKGDEVAWGWKSRAGVGTLLTSPSQTFFRHVPRRPRRDAELTAEEWHRLLMDTCRRRGLSTALGTHVTAISREGSVWELSTNGGTYRAKCVAVCTGAHSRERAPIESDGSIPVMKALDFDRTARRWEETLVVGGGTSGCDIARQVCERSGFASLSVRRIPLVLPPRIFGVSVVDMANLAQHCPNSVLDLVASLAQRFAFGELPWRVAAKSRRLSERRSTKFAPTVDFGFVDCLKQNRIRVFPETLRIREGRVHFADSSSRTFSHVVSATGYESDIANLFVNAAVLERDGFPRDPRALRLSAPGVYFVGMRPSIRAFSSSMPRTSIRVAREMQSYLRRFRTDRVPKRGRRTQKSTA